MAKISFLKKKKRNDKRWKLGTLSRKKYKKAKLCLMVETKISVYYDCQCCKNIGIMPLPFTEAIDIYYLKKLNIVKAKA